MQNGLAISESDRDMQFRESWSQQAIDTWVRELLPKPFAWLDARYGIPDIENGEVHWVLLKRDHSTLFVVGRKEITGTELSNAKGTVAKNPSQWSVRIGQWLP